MRALKTHCPHGHEFTPENTYEYAYRGSTMRKCKTCTNAYGKERRRCVRENIPFETAPRNSDKTHCPAGHPYDEENTYPSEGNHRVCIPCNRAKARIARIQSYGISADEYEDMLIAQEGRCKICRKEFGAVSPHIDHCHETGLVRDLLCLDCNLGLGMYRDDPDRMRRAADYLDGHAARIQRQGSTTG